MSIGETQPTIRWRTLFAVLISHPVLNIAWLALYHILEPGTANPFYTRVNGGWQAGSIIAPSLFALTVLVLAATGSLRFSFDPILVVLLTIGSIALGNLLISMPVGALSA